MKTVNVSEPTKEKFRKAHRKYEAGVGERVSEDKMMLILLEVYEHENRSY